MRHLHNTVHTITNSNKIGHYTRRLKPQERGASTTP